MHAAVDDVQHRHGQRPRVVAAERAKERDTALGRGRLRRGERHAEDRVRAEPSLVRRAVQFDQPPVERGLILRVEPAHGVRDLAVHVRNRAQDGLASVRIAAVAQLDRLVHAGRRARRDGGAPERARFEPNFRLHRRIAARIENLARANRSDRTHSNATFARSK